MPSINEMRADRARIVEEMGALVRAAETEKRDLTAGELARVQRLDLDASDIAETVDRLTVEERDAALAAVGERRDRYGTVAAAAEDWSRRAADAIRAMSGDHRALVSGSVDIPQLLPVDVVGLPQRPTRVLDLIPRAPLVGNEYEYIRQVARTNNAAPVADAATKPTSVFTVQAISDRARVVAHLSEYIPNRILDDHTAVRRWLNSELASGVLVALEDQVVTGTSVGENLTGVLNTVGRTTVAFSTSKLQTLRKAFTALANLHEQPTAWVLSTGDAEELDLLREGTDGGFLAAPVGLSNIFKDLPIVVSTALSTNTAVLADWRQALVYVRENVQIAVDTASRFHTNETRMRGEGRFGFAVLRPQSFAHISLSV